MTNVTRRELEARDASDPLHRFRAEFELPAGVIYLDGNSLGALARRARERLGAVIEKQWGQGLIRSWNDADWIGMPQRTGDKIAQLVGAAPGEVVAADSTSVNLFKALSVAVHARPGRRFIVSERANFPTDLHVIQGLVSQLGNVELVLAEPTNEGVEQCLARHGSDVAAVLLTHIHYTTSRIYDMARVTRAAHAPGALMIWDLSHSAGIVPVDLHACDADFAVGCGYKHLNGGPGAPAFIYVARRMQDSYMQPISGWMGDARPFDFRGEYEPAPGINRYLSGTPPVIGMASLEASVEVILEAPMEEIRRKSIALGDLFVALMESRCGKLGFELISPREGGSRGSHVSYRHEASYPIMQALIAGGVVGDCRPPDLVRFGFAPLYNRYVDIWDAVDRIEKTCATGAWRSLQDRPRNEVI